MKAELEKKVPEVACGPSFYPRGIEMELIFALPAAISEVRLILKISVFEHERRNLKKSSRKLYMEMNAVHHQKNRWRALIEIYKAAKFEHSSNYLS